MLWGIHNWTHDPNNYSFWWGGENLLHLKRNGLNNISWTIERLFLIIWSKCPNISPPPFHRGARIFRTFFAQWIWEKYSNLEYSRSGCRKRLFRTRSQVTLGPQLLAECHFGNSVFRQQQSWQMLPKYHRKLRVDIIFKPSHSRRINERPSSY